MEYGSQLELYKKLIPVLKVKERLIKASNVNDININDIWHYLAINKWKYSTNLTISDIVNDIITIDINIIRNEEER